MNDPIVSHNPEVQRMYENRVPLIEDTCCHDKLLPCPFCGSEAEESCYPTLAQIKCMGCECNLYGHGPLSPQQLQEGVCWLVTRKRWNERAALPDVERLRNHRSE